MDGTVVRVFVGTTGIIVRIAGISGGEIIARRRRKELVARRWSNNFNFPGYTVGLPLVTAEAVSKLKAPSTNIASSLPVLIVPSRYKRRNQWKRGKVCVTRRKRALCASVHRGQVLQGTNKKLRNPITRAIDFAGFVAPPFSPLVFPGFSARRTRLYYQRWSIKLRQRWARKLG